MKKARRSFLAALPGGNLDARTYTPYMPGLGGWRGAQATVAILTCAIGCYGEEPAETNSPRHCFDEPYLVADISNDHGRSVSFYGTGYDIQGETVARWHTTAVGIDEEGLRVIYHWKGYLQLDKSKAAEEREGWGDIRFSSSRINGPVDRAHGHFTDNKLGSLRSEIKTVSMQRASAEEIRAIEAGPGKLFRERFVSA